MTTKNDLDPFRVIVGVLANRGDSDLLMSVCLAAGLTFDVAVENDPASHRTRIRALLPRIFKAYDPLEDQSKLSVAGSALRNFGRSYPETQQRAAEALASAGWEIRGDDLVVVSPDVREMFFPSGSQWDAHVVLRNLFNEAKQSLTIVGAYANGTVFEMLSARPVDGLTIQVLCSVYAKAVAAEGKAFTKQFPGVIVEVGQTKDFHDRFIVIDQATCVHVGASIKDAGKTAFMVSRVEDPENQKAILAALAGSWQAAARL